MTAKLQRNFEKLLENSKQLHELQFQNISGLGPGSQSGNENKQLDLLNENNKLIEENRKLIEDQNQDLLKSLVLLNLMQKSLDESKKINDEREKLIGNLGNTIDKMDKILGSNNHF